MVLAVWVNEKKDVSSDSEAESIYLSLLTNCVVGQKENISTESRKGLK